ncbi:MAG: hypothetical protein ACK59A_08175 [Cyanobacteriota bacterium]
MSPLAQFSMSPDIPIILPDAHHSGILPERVKLAEEWEERLNALTPSFKRNPILFGMSGCEEYFLIDQFARNISDMLKLLHDQYQPRKIDRLIKEGFKELCQQILED